MSLPLINEVHTQFGPAIKVFIFFLIGLRSQKYVYFIYVRQKKLSFIGFVCFVCFVANLSDFGLLFYKLKHSSS